MSAVVVAIVVLVAFVAGLLGTAFVYRRKKGRFNVLRDDSVQYRFLSNFGDITINGDERAVAITSKMNTKVIRFDEIQRLDYSHFTSRSFFQELVRGVQLSDFTDVGGDVDNWFQLSLVLDSGKLIPLYLVGQWEARAPLGEWLHRIQKALLHKLGLYKDVEGPARDAVQQVQRAFARYQRPLTLV